MAGAGGGRTKVKRQAATVARRSLGAIALAPLLLAQMPAFAAPSTFGPVIGSALLCRSHLDNAFFYAYLESAFGPSYKHEGGAYWFKAEGSLWGTSISDVLVSDDSSELTFLGAVAEATPAGLDEAIVKSAGVHHNKVDASAFSALESQPGSKIVYFDARSKIYCAKYKPLPVAF
jgi:hypothetical protein